MSRREESKDLPESEDRIYTDEEIEAMLRDGDFDEEDEFDPPIMQRPFVKKMIAGLLAFALFGNIIAFWPQIYSIAAIQFLVKSRELSQLEEIQQFKESIVVVSTDESKGTGFNIAEDGLIITNDHVIADHEPIWVSFPNKELMQAEVIARDERLDIALLDVTGSDLPTLELAENPRWTRGDPIYIIGNPLSFRGIANEGNILGLRANRQPQVMMLQAPVYRGNSGSPVIDDDGQVIAVVFATTTVEYEEEKEKVGLAVPAELIWEVFDEHLN